MTFYQSKLTAQTDFLIGARLRVNGGGEENQDGGMLVLASLLLVCALVCALLWTFFAAVALKPEVSVLALTGFERARFAGVDPGGLELLGLLELLELLEILASGFFTVLADTLPALTLLSCRRATSADVFWSSAKVCSAIWENC